MFCVYCQCFTAVIASNSFITLDVTVLKDGGCAPLLKDRNADIPVSSELGRGSWLLKGTRDPVQEPIGFLVFTLEARVTTLLTNPRRCFAHVDVM